MYRWNQILIAGHKSFFVVFGLFGNFHLLFLVLITPKFRSKSSYLQCIQTFAQIFCILNSIIDIYLMLSDSRISRRTCFQLILPTVFSYCLQSSIMLFILLDILLTVLYPITILSLSTWKYVLGMSTSPILWGAAIVVWGFQNLDDTPLVVCVTTSALHPDASHLVFPVTLTSNTLSLLVFLVLTVIFRCKNAKVAGKTSNYSRKIMRHLQVSAALFIFSTYFTSFASNWLVLSGYTEDEFDNIVGNITIFAMFSYSHTFYTIIWRSPEYRRRFIGLYIRSAGRKITVISQAEQTAPTF